MRRKLMVFEWFYVVINKNWIIVVVYWLVKKWVQRLILVHTHVVLVVEGCVWLMVVILVNATGWQLDICFGSPGLMPFLSFKSAMHEQRTYLVLWLFSCLCGNCLIGRLRRARLVGLNIYLSDSCWLVSGLTHFNWLNLVLSQISLDVADRCCNSAANSNHT